MPNTFEPLAYRDYNGDGEIEEGFLVYPEQVEIVGDQIQYRNQTLRKLFLQN